MSNWRPGDWEQKNKIEDISIECTDFSDSSMLGLHKRIFEAGADAMLWALKDMALVVAPAGVFPKYLRGEDE